MPEIAQYWITVLLGGACSVLSAFFGAALDDKMSEDMKKAWKYVPALLSGAAAEVLPETVPGATAQTRWIFGLLSVSVWYVLYPYLEKLVEKKVQAKLGALSDPKGGNDASSS